MSSWHIANDSGNELLSRLDEVVECDRNFRHAAEAPFELLGDVFARRRKHFRHRPVVAEHVDDEGRSQIVVDPFVRKKVPHIEEIARVLAVKCGHQLAGIQIREGHELSFGETKFHLHAL